MTSVGSQRHSKIIYMEGGNVSQYCVTRNSVRRLSWVLSESGATLGFEYNNRISIRRIGFELPSVTALLRI
jgi:hypothetical protein